MSRTTRKLDEASFFLGFLERKPHGVEWLEFHYYLSAFVSAARSVLWIMRAEYSHVPGWQEWYDAKEATPEEQRLLNAFNQIRVRSVKKDPLETRGRVEISIPKDQITPELE